MRCAVVGYPNVVSPPPLLSPPTLQQRFLQLRSMTWHIFQHHKSRGQNRQRPVLQYIVTSWTFTCRQHSSSCHSCALPLHFLQRGKRRENYILRGLKCQRDLEIRRSRTLLHASEVAPRAHPRAAVRWLKQAESQDLAKGL